MQPENKLRLGILGAAAIARKNIPAALAAGWDVAAVAARDESRAASLCRDLGLPPSTVRPSYDAVIADDSIHAVYIPLPSAVHVAWVRAAAAAGKHILLEKPVAINDADTDAIAQAVTQASVVLLDGTMQVARGENGGMINFLARRKPRRPPCSLFPHQQYRWVHSRRAAALSSDLPRLGPLHTVTASFTFCAPPAFFQHPGGDCRTDPTADPLGCLGDLGWYCCRAALWALAGDGASGDLPSTAAAHVGARVNDRGVPISAGGSLAWDDGTRTATFDVGFTRCQTQHLAIHGVAGTVTLDDFVIPSSENSTAYTLRLAAPTVSEERALGGGGKHEKMARRVARARGHQ